MRTVATVLALVLLAGAGAAWGDRAGAPAPRACGVICGDDIPAWSPDGRTIAFLHYVPGASGPRETLAVVPAAGGALRTVVGVGSLYPQGSGPIGPFDGISWSPDSETLALHGFRAGAWTVPTAGGPPRPLSPYLPVWSPDSRQVVLDTPRDAFAARYPMYVPAEIRVAAADGSSPRVLAGSDVFLPGVVWAANPAWSRNDDIAYVTGQRDAFGKSPRLETEEIWSIRPDGTGARRLVPAGLRGSKLGYQVLGWSADGERLFFIVRDVDDVAHLAQVPRGGGTSELLYGVAHEDRCCWLSPDSTRLALFRPGRDRRFDLYVVAVAGGTEKRIVSGLTGRSIVGLSWSPDGTRVAFASGDECGPLFGIETLAADGSHRTRLTSPCRRVGTSGRDVLRGGPGPDALYGRAGTDALDGRGGPDFLQGGAGSDAVYGGAGDDRLYGGPGQDVIFGDGGSDTIEAREHTTDLIRCGTGDDHVRADRADRVARDCEFVERR